ncbi:MAG: LysR substrate-binding domain-containing protein [Pseudomonadota bacterium]
MAIIRHLRALQAFDVVAKRSNLSRAAEDLGVTHGAVSRQIKQLEEHLGVALLRRLPGGVDLTDARNGLHLSTQQAFALLEQGVATTRRIQARHSISVSLSSSLAIKWLVPKLPEFHKRHPGISLSLVIDEGFADFSERGVDVALRYTGSVPSELFGERLTKEHPVVVAAPSLAPDGLATPASITRLPLLHDQFHPCWGAWAMAAGISEPDVQSRSTALPDSAVLIAAAIAGQGAILVRHILVEDDLRAGRLVRLSDVRAEQKRALYFVCRSGDQRVPPVSTLRAWLNEICPQL